MGFQQGLSGLNATSKNLEVIGNNIANANTFGAKASRAEFADVYAAALNTWGTVALSMATYPFFSSRTSRVCTVVLQGKLSHTTFARATLHRR